MTYTSPSSNTLTKAANTTSKKSSAEKWAKACSISQEVTTRIDNQIDYSNSTMYSVSTTLDASLNIIIWETTEQLICPICKQNFETKGDHLYNANT